MRIRSFKGQYYWIINSNLLKVTTFFYNNFREKNN